MIYHHQLFYFLNVVLHSVIYIFFVVMPFKSKLRYGLPKTVLCAFGWVIFTGVCNGLFFEIEAPLLQLRSQMSLVWIGVSALLMIALIEEKSYQLLFVLFVLFAFQNNIICCARLIYALQIFEPILAEFEQLNYLIYTVVALLIVVPFFWHLCINMLQKIVEVKMDFLQWKYLLILPFTYYVYCRVSDFGGVDLLKPQIRDIYSLMLLNGCAYFSYVAALQMLLKAYENYTIKEEVHFMAKQLDIQKGQYERLTENIEKTNRLRHDWRHHLLVINDYAKMNNLAALTHYLSHYFKECSTTEEASICNNYSVDIILRHYLSIAKAQGVKTTVSVQIAENSVITNQELSIVFGNLVENAVENCLKNPEEQSFIDIKAQPVGQQLAIIIQNSFSGEVLKDEDKFLSTKHEGYGMGISSVRSIVESHGGSFKVSHNNSVFKVALLFCV